MIGEPVYCADPETLPLPVQRGDPSSFATLARVLAELPRVPSCAAHAHALTNLSAAIERLRRAEQALAAERTLDGAVLTSRGVLAALRRVTRESVEIAMITDRAARLLARVLVRPALRRVVVPSADEIDRPSVKALVRACLLGQREEAPVWEWHFSAVPDGAHRATTHIDELARDVRAEMVRTIATVLGLSRRSGTTRSRMVGELSAPPYPPCQIGIACNWLTTQNYDAAIKWALDALATERHPDALRVLAVAATNTGRHDAAIRTFNEAYQIAKKPTMRAHLCSMQALIIAKRKFDLAGSQRWYEQGLAELSGAADDDDGDPALEEAWIYNGLALNALLEARFSRRPIGSAFDATFDLLRRAFALVQEGGSADYVYLRYNLLGNMSAFMSLQGQHRIALDLFERAFDASLTEGLADAREWRAVLAARRAGLYAGAGEIETALEHYRDAVEMLVESDRPVCAEALRRSAGILALRLARAGEAESMFREGLNAALDSRSMVGAKVHGAGLVHALVCQDQASAAADVLMELGETHGVWLADIGAGAKTAALSLQPPTRLFGLSTSIPEIDLENLEPVSIAGVLSDVETAPRAAAART